MSKLLILAAASLALLVAMGPPADAHLFHHRHAHYSYYSCYWPLYASCGCYSGAGACGYGGACGYAGGGDCGYQPSYGRRHCHLFGWLHNCCLKHKNRKWWTGCSVADCGGSCGSLSGACGSTSTDSATPSTVISGEALPRGEAVPTAVEDPQASKATPKFRLTSLRHDGNPAFQRGLAAFRLRNMSEAAGAFNAAVELEPDNAMYHYYLALTTYDLAGADAANDARQKAVELEQREPIKDWGKRMERVQGRSRAWIEQARRDAGLVR